MSNLLNEFIEKYDLTLREFATLIGVSTQHVSNITNGKIMVSRKLATAIEIATKGEVKSNDLMINLTDPNAIRERIERKIEKKKKQIEEEKSKLSS